MNTFSDSWQISYSSAAIHPSPVLPVILDLPLKAMKDVMIFCKCI